MIELPMFLRTLLLIVVFMLLAAAIAPAAEVAAWEFDKGPAGWRDEAGSAPQTSELGTLWAGSVEGVSLRSPALDVPSQAFQTVELSASAAANGLAHLLWQGESHTGSPTGWQGAVPVQVPADGQVHQLRLLPLWQNLRVIAALRLVGPPGLQLRLRSLRIVGQDAAPVSQSEWSFANRIQAGQWLPLVGLAVLRQQAEGMQVRLEEQQVLLASPPLLVPTYRSEWLSLNLTSRDAARARVQWATTAQRGLHGAALLLSPGRHTYNIHTADEPSWSGMLAGLALGVGEQFIAPEGAMPFDAAQGLRNRAATEITLHELSLSNAPQGPADLRTAYAGPLEARLLSKRPFRLVWVLQNEGGEPARDVRVTVRADEGISIPVGATVIDRMDHGVPEPITWLVKAAGPGAIHLRADWDDQTLTEEVRLQPFPEQAVVAAERVPPPAAKAQNLLLAHYQAPPLPAWGPAALDRMLYRRPYLGDYEVQPEVIDWQVKWALESGLAGFVVDVARGQGEVLDAFLGSRLARQAKLCLRWTAPAPTTEAGRALLQELGPILAGPNIVRAQDKPVVIVGHALQRGPQGWGLCDLQALSAEGQVALIACLPLNMASPELLQKAGYVAALDLHTEELVQSRQPVLESWDEAAGRHVPHVLCLQPAWDEQMTPARLRTMLQIALLRSQRADSFALAPVIVGDWNGEAGLEPRRPEGRQWLEAVRQVAGLPETPLVLPEDVGLGPYDRRHPAPPRAWEFDSKETWTSAMGMNILSILGGQLTGRTDSAEPAIFGGDTMLDTRHFHTALIGLSASAGKQGRLYWRTSLRKLTLEHSLPFDLIADGAVHEYRLDLSRAPGWEGYLESLRLDPTDVAGAAIALDYIRLVP